MTGRGAGGFAVLEHPADIGIAFSGASLPEALEQAARGLTSLLVGDSPVEERRSLVVTVEGRDSLELLFNWLGELLLAFDADGFICARFKIETLGDNAVRAELLGEDFDPVRHQPVHDVKAITYHQMELAPDAKGAWHGRVYFDI